MEQYCMYLRKSRFDRDYAELSIDETLSRHKAILDKLASDRKLFIAKIYYEVVSGESIAARPQIQAMLEEVNNNLYNGVLVVDLERLARGNGADQAYISQVFQFTGTKIITPLKDYDPSNEFDEEYFEFGLFMSRREYKTINRRLIRGRDSSASEGKYIGSIAPYGYQRKKIENEKGYTLIPDPNESKVVQKIFEMYCNYEGTKTIANYLNDHSIPTRHGDLWTYSTISNIISNPIYIGKIRRGWSKQIKSIQDGVVVKSIKRKKEMNEYQTYDGLHPALVSKDYFEKAQNIRRSKRPTPKTKTNCNLQNSFAGLLFCGYCGKRIGRTTTTVANGATPRLRCINARNCHNSSSDYKIVEGSIINALKQWLEGYKIKINTIGFSNDIIDCKTQLEKLELEKQKLSQQLDKAFNLVEQGVYTLETFQTRREKIELSIKEIDDKILNVKQTISKFIECDSAQNNLIPQTEELLSSYDKMSIADRNELLKAILYKVEYRRENQGKVEIDLYPKIPRL